MCIKPEFCVENEDDVNDWIEAGCNVGTFIGSAAVMFFSGGIAAPVALYTIGAQKLQVMMKQGLRINLDQNYLFHKQL
ncbi:MAG: hypothetical protein KAS90_03745 [Candidatus Aenigmarchaeota archaeon]|nr:hypothetical protein [Candidatus Aenigmarchaeota archaeon]